MNDRDTEVGPLAPGFARENQLLRIYATASRLVAQQRDPALVHAEVCRLLVDEGGFALAWVGLCEPDGRLTVAVCHGEKRAYAEGLELRWDDTPLGHGPTGTAVRERRPIVTVDLVAQAAFLPWKERAEAHGLAASASTPLRADHRALGALTVYSTESAPFEPALIRVLEEVGDLLGFALAAADEARARKEADGQLRASEERYRLLFERNPQPVWVYDRATLAILAVNQAMIGRYGFAREELLTMSIAALRLPEDVPALLDRLGHHPTELRPVGVFRHRSKDGATFEVELTVSDLSFEGRDARLVLAVEVTERERARRALEASDEALRASEELARTAFNASPDIMTVSELQRGTLVAVNEAFVRTTGFTREEALGTSLTALGMWVNPDDKIRALERLAGTAHIDNFEALMRMRDGRTLLASIAVDQVVFGGERCLIAAARDVTEARRIETERAHLLAAIEQMAEVLVVTDAAGAIVLVNPSFERVTGWTQAEAIGQSPRLLKSGHQDDAFYVRMWSTLTRGEVFRGMVVNRRKDGTVYHADVAISPVRDAAGTITHYVGVQRDTTQEHALQAQLLHAQKMEVVGRVAGGVAHDFNNILTAILTSAQFLLEDLPEGDPRRADAEVVLESAERAAALTRQLLAFSRKEIVAPRALDLNVLITNLSRMLMRLLREDIRLTVTPSPGEAPLFADPGQLEQVVMNLVVNAREAIPGTGWITLSTRFEGPGTLAFASHGCVVIEVRDSGAGISEATRARIFEPFFTTKERGTGLGLATVRGIVDGLGGTIEVESELGRGTLFRVRLPLSAPVTATADSAHGSLAAPRPTRVLLVEDDSALRALFSRVLVQHGYAVTAASSVVDAALKARALGERLDLLVTDLVLPDGNGYTLARELAAKRVGLRTLLVSGYTGDLEVIKEISESSVAFLPKPFTPRGILQALRALLAGDAPG